MKIGNLEVYGIIYKITNIKNNKSYIGQTIDEKGFDGRYHNSLEKNTHNVYLKRSIEKYGIKNFEVNKILDVAFSRNELNIKEDMWIKHYDSTNKDFGYNLTVGGSFGDYSEDYLEHMREIQKSIPVIQLDFDGNIIKIWKHGCREASKKLKYDQAVIWRCCNRNQSSYKGYIWLYIEDYNKNGVDTYWHESNSRFKRVVQLDVKSYEIIKIWNSISEINEVLGLDNSSISKCCLNKINYCYDYKWQYYIDYKQKCS